MKPVAYQTMRCCFIFFVTLFFLFGSDMADAGRQETVQGKKVLVVASYHAGHKWVEDVVDSLKQNLRGAQLTFFYMDTKRNLAGASEKAGEAFKLYRKIQPDAVITIDDNAQEFFVVPYLKDKVIGTKIISVK